MSRCGYPPCGMSIARHLLMCAPHWRLVTKPVQDRVYRYYKAQDWANWGRALDDARVDVAKAIGDKIPARLMKEGA